MEIVIKVENQNNFDFLIQLLNQFKFISDIQINSNNIIEKSEIENIKEKYKYLPIRWGDSETKIQEFAGIWKNKNITLKQLREKAWKRD